MGTNKKKWQQDLINSFTNPQQLLKYLNTQPLSIDLSNFNNFPFLVSESFANRMEPKNINDPLLKQILPINLENANQPKEYSKDPLNEAKYSPIPGLIHKYKSRVLIILSTHCAINCRYCFRRNFPYKSNQISQKTWLKIINYIDQSPQINEIIFSGGDPLIMPDSQIKNKINTIATIPHIKTIRFHTRIPIVLPSRIDDGFIDLLKFIQNKNLQSIIILHCNHPNELNNEIKIKLNKIYNNTNCKIYNQAVLLKDINDNINTQVTLWQKCYEIGIMPYYLHLFDKVNGAAHFEVPEKLALGLYTQIQTELPGYMTPKLARETPGEAFKKTNFS